MSPTFDRYIGIDYSGAKTPISSLKGLRVYEGDNETASREILPPKGPRRYWTRRGIAEWLVAELSVGPPTLVGIDHAFSFPLKYFEQHGLPLDWPSFLDDFQRHWPTDEDRTYVDFVRERRLQKRPADRESVLQPGTSRRTVSMCVLHPLVASIRSAEMLPLALGIPVGVGSRTCDREQPSRSSTLMSRDQSQSPRTPVFHGCVIFESISATGFVSGRLRDGAFRRAPL
jgi:hypothetical protein